MITAGHRQQLLEIARAAIVARVCGDRAPSVEPTGVLGSMARAFVTLHSAGELRGCIGHVQEDQPLWEVVRDCAAAASTRDPRFPAVTLSEVASLTIEISVLGPFEAVPSPGHIEVGRHGVLVEQGRRRGLLLPQVATEWGWDACTLVEQTCRKAGLPSDAWQRGAALFRFEAEMFAESE